MTPSGLVTTAILASYPFFHMIEEKEYLRSITLALYIRTC